MNNFPEDTLIAIMCAMNYEEHNGVNGQATR